MSAEIKLELLGLIDQAVADGWAHAGACRVHHHVVNAEADLGRRLGEVFGPQSAVDRLPGVAAVVGAEGARRGDGDPEAPGVARVEQDLLHERPFVDQVLGL